MGGGAGERRRRECAQADSVNVINDSAACSRNTGACITRAG